MSAAAEIIAALGAAVPGAQYEELQSSDSDVTPVILAPAERVLATAQALRNTPGLEFHAFSDVTAVDFYPQRQPRFDLVYHFVSPHRRARVRMKVRVAGGQSIASVTPVWQGAGWPEREVYDLFGILFDGHDDLRRLLMPEDWEGHPARKDYPVQIRKAAQTYEPLEVSEQEFRSNIERDRVRRAQH